uniref:Gustatory receptor n=1 Tax=Culicoides sonorensis TaxID=179676 RepID=A0A336M6L3_CULSO
MKVTQVKPYPKPKKPFLKLVDKDKERFANELEAVIKPFIFLCQIFCTAPPCIKFSDEIFKIKDEYRLNCKQRIISYIHHIWSCFVLISVCLATYYQNTQFDYSMGFLTKTLYIGEYVFAAFNVVLIIIGCNYQRRNYFYFFEQLIDIDMELLKCGVKPKYPKYKKDFNQMMGCYSIFFTLVLLVDFFYNKMNVPSFFRSSTVYTIPNIIWVLSLSQFGSVMLLVKVKLKTINAILLGICKEMPYAEDTETREKLLLAVVLKIENEKIKPGENVSCKVVESLRRLHAKVCVVGHSATNSFGILLSITILAGFVVLNIQFFQLYKTSESLEPYDLFLFLYTLLWIVLYGGKVVGILYVGHIVSEEKAKTGPILYDLEGREDKQDTHFRDIIHKFSMQLLHEESSHTACGVVKLELTILSSLLNTLTTYLVILIQFDTAGRTSNIVICKNFTNDTPQNPIVVKVQY